jgi:hypothetical protein
MTMQQGTDFEINTTHSNDPPGDGETYAGTDETVVQYVRLNHSVDPDVTFGNTAVDYRVNKSALPAGTSADQVTLRRWNSNQGQWNEMSAELVGESVTHYFYASETPGFSQFVISAPTPSTPSGTPSGDDSDSSSGGGHYGPIFDVREISDIDSRISTGDSLTITSTVRNLGSAAGAYELRVEGESGTIASTTVTIPGGRAEQLTVTPTFTEPGTYSVLLDGSVVETITVQAADGTVVETTTAPVTTDAEPETEPSPSPTTSRDETTSEPTTTERDDPGLPWLPIGMGLFLVFLIGILVSRREDSEDERETESSDRETAEPAEDGDADGRPDS